ncbi:MAG: succinate dehydrogenase, cytochrome b556 subunit [Pseudomonadota bacterium]
MADVNRGNRPLSPHIEIYRPQWTSVSSILVRITGIASLGTALIIVVWLLMAATSEGAFQAANWWMQSWLGKLVLLAATWAIFYHTLGRLRHVIWDFGYCLEVAISEQMAKGMFALATILTLIVAIFFLGVAP